MDNPQGNEARAWIAGLWLADGHLGCDKHHNKKEQSYRPTADLAGNDRPHLEMAYSVLRAHGIGAWFWTPSRRYAHQKRIVCHVKVTAWGKIVKFVDFVEPYLVGRKHLQALILREVASYSDGSYRALPSWQREMREWAHQTIQATNRGFRPSETIIAAPPYPVEDEGIVQALREIQG